MSDKTDNPGIYAMLEEIKEEQKRARTAQPAQVPQAAPDLTPVTAKLNEHLGPIAAKINSAVKGMGDTATSIGTTATKIETSAENLPAAVGKAITETIRKQIPLEVKYRYTVDFKSSKAAVFIIMGVVFLSLSIFGNIYQGLVNSDYRDVDLKYRYIKMKGGISAEDVSRMEAFFGYNRDEDAIKQTRRNVEQYEQAVAEQAQRIEQARLNAIRAEQLRQEAEQLKNKK